MTTSAMTARGTETILSDTHIKELRDALRGELIANDHAGYEGARRVWNGNIDRRPALVVRCAGVADVQQSVNLHGSHNLRLSVRGGGHSAPGYGTNDGGLVIDLSLIKGIQVNPPPARCERKAASLWRDLDHETQAFGLASTGGTVSNTGVAGLTTGGGLGWLMGKHGLPIDNLLSADIVTADGQFRKASASAHPDLFWAIRGGGGNFGIATSLEFRLHPVSQVLGGLCSIHWTRLATCSISTATSVRRCRTRRKPYAVLLTDAPGDAGGGVDTRIQRSDRGRRKGVGARPPVRNAHRRPGWPHGVCHAPEAAGRTECHAWPAPLLALRIHGAHLG